jgi:HEAT repeat protein
MKSMIATLAAIASLAVTAQNAMDLATQLNWAKPQDGKRIVIELQKLGQEGVNQLVANLSEANGPNNVAAEFALEALTQKATNPGEDKAREALAEALANALPAAKDNVAKAIVIKQLEWCGGDAQVAAVAPALNVDKLRTYAINTLAQINSENAQKALRDAANAATPEVALEYAPAFNKNRDPQAAPILMKMLPEAKPHQQAIVYSALAHLGHAPAADMMVETLKTAASTYQKAAARGALSILVANIKNKAQAIEVAKKFNDAEVSEASLTALLDAQGPEATVQTILDEAVKGDFVRREAMLRLLSKAPQAVVVPKAIATAKQADPAVTAAIISMLGIAADKSALPFVTGALDHADPAVRAAAAQTLPAFGAENAVTILVAKLAAAKDDDVNIFKDALRWQQTANFDQAVATAIPNATPSAKIALAELLALRKAAEQNNAVIDMLQGDDNVRKAAIKALETIATPDDTRKLLDFMLATESAADRRGLQNVLSILAKNSEKAAQVLVEGMGKATAESKATLLQTMSKIGTDPALNAVVAALADNDQNVKTAAVRALSDWPNRNAIDELDKLARQKDNELHRALAYRGFVRLAAIQAPASRTTNDIVAQLKEGLKLAANDEEKKRVLSAVSSVRCDVALMEIVIPAFDNPNTAQEAAAAAVAIACPKDNRDRGIVSPVAREALEKVIALASNDALKNSAKNHLATFPPAGINVAFGKPVTTSCAQEGNHAPEKAVDGIIHDRDAAWFGVKWPSSITVDLQKEESIDFIRPIFYYDGSRSYAYTVEISSDNKAWKQVVDMSTNTAAATENGLSHPIAPAEKARYVRLNILKNSANQAVHLVEFEVYSISGKLSPSPIPNLLFRQPVTAGSLQEDHYAPTRVNDGKIGRYDGWHTDQCPTWITVDMQQEAELDTIRVIYFWDTIRSYSYNIEVSLDNKTWTRVADNSNNRTPVTAQGIVHTFKPIKARYVKLNCTGNGKYQHVVELEAYATGTAPKEFPAAEKPVIKTPPLPPADKDGFINLFNGKDMTGWIGSTTGYGVKEGGIMYCDPKKGGMILTQWEFADFELQFDFLLTEAANNGLAIRTPAQGNPAYVGMELQIIDNDGYKAKKGNLQPWQHHGSIYGVVPAKDGALKKPGEWNHQVVIAKGSKIKVILNDQVIVDADIATIQETADGQGRAKHPGLDRRSGHIGWLGHGDYVEFKNIRIKPLEPYVDGPHNVPPEGYVALFNGKDLTGWKGLVGNPESRAKMTPEQLAEAQKKADDQMRAHWTVVDGVIVFDGKGSALCTAKDYKDFDMYVDWKMTRGGDSGIYLRGSPQVQIWDPEQWKIGSGGLYNNQKNPSNPTSIMDNPIGQWNRFRIKMVGEKVSVWLNGTLVVDNVVMENYWNRKIPIYPSGQIELQNHNSPLWFRNIYIKEL